MKIEINDVIPFENGDYLKKIEQVGRVSYKSEGRITEDSAAKFVKMLEDKGHGAALEHGIIYLTMFLGNSLKNEIVDFFKANPYSTVVIEDGHAFVTTNYRVISENKLHKALDYMSEKTNNHVQIFTFKFICSRATANEFVRHRKFSFMQESTRYCNYSLDKFDNQIACIPPMGITLNRDSFSIWKSAMESAESAYNSLIKEEKTEMARSVLPLSLKTELVMTGSLMDWVAFLRLRSPKMGAKGVNPDAAYLADKVYDFIFKDGE